MIKIYTGLKGNLVFLFLMAGLVLFVSIFSWGVTKAIQLLLPLLIVLSYLLIAVFLFGILPSTFLKKLRPALAVYSMLMSHALGVLTWMVSFFLVIKVFGFLGVFLCFLFQLLAPIAIAGAMIKGSWTIAGHLALWVGFTYGMRVYSQRLLNLNEGGQNPQKGDIIDVEAVEVRDKLKG